MGWCFMYKKNGELVDYLLLHCDVVKVLWDKVFIGLGIAWVMPGKIVNLLACQKGIQGNSQIAAVWKMVLLCLMWCTCNERNGRCFDNREGWGGGLRVFSIIRCFFGLQLCIGRDSFDEFYAVFSQLLACKLIFFSSILLVYLDYA